MTERRLARAGTKTAARPNTLVSPLLARRTGFSLAAGFDGSGRFRVEGWNIVMVREDLLVQANVDVAACHRHDD